MCCLPKHASDRLRMLCGLYAVWALLILPDAAFAHRGEFRLSAKTPASSAHAENGIKPDPARPADLPADHEALRRIVREELERMLPPLPERHRETAPSFGREDAPGLREILGGLGWIAGLAALFAWYRGRRAP